MELMREIKNIRMVGIGPASAIDEVTVDSPEANLSHRRSTTSAESRLPTAPTICLLESTLCAAVHLSRKSQYDKNHTI